MNELLYVCVCTVLFCLSKNSLAGELKKTSRTPSMTRGVHHLDERIKQRRYKRVTPPVVCGGGNNGGEGENEPEEAGAGDNQQGGGNAGGQGPPQISNVDPAEMNVIQLLHELLILRLWRDEFRENVQWLEANELDHFDVQGHVTLVGQLTDIRVRILHVRDALEAAGVGPLAPENDNRKRFKRSRNDASSSLQFEPMRDLLKVLENLGTQLSKHIANATLMKERFESLRMNSAAVSKSVQAQKLKRYVFDFKNTVDEPLARFIDASMIWVDRATVLLKLKDDLVKELDGEFFIDGDGVYFINTLLTEPMQLDKHEVTRVESNNEDRLILADIVVTRSGYELQRLHDSILYYDAKYKKKSALERCEINNHKVRQFVTCAIWHRNESAAVDWNLAKTDAWKLIWAYYGVQAKFPSDVQPIETLHQLFHDDDPSGVIYDPFPLIMCQRSMAQIRATIFEYDRIVAEGHVGPLKSMLTLVTNWCKASSCNNMVRDMILATVRYAESPSRYYAWLLYKSMKGAGTWKKLLGNIIAQRSEVSIYLQIDLESIKTEFLKKYGSCLENWIFWDAGSNSLGVTLMRMVGYTMPEDSCSGWWYYSWVYDIFDERYYD